VVPHTVWLPPFPPRDRHLPCPPFRERTACLTFLIPYCWAFHISPPRWKSFPAICFIFPVQSYFSKFLFKRVGFSLPLVGSIPFSFSPCRIGGAPMKSSPTPPSSLIVSGRIFPFRPWQPSLVEVVFVDRVGQLPLQVRIAFFFFFFIPYGFHRVLASARQERCSPPLPRDN